MKLKKTTRRETKTASNLQQSPPHGYQNVYKRCKMTIMTIMTTKFTTTKEKKNLPLVYHQQ